MRYLQYIIIIVYALQILAVLNTFPLVGQTTAMAAQRTTGDGNYSQLGPRDCERVNEQ